VLHIFVDFDVVYVQTAEIWQLNSITVKLTLCFCPGTKSSNSLDLMPNTYSR